MQIMFGKLHGKSKYFYFSNTVVYFGKSTNTLVKVYIWKLAVIKGLWYVFGVQFSFRTHFTSTKLSNYVQT